MNLDRISACVVLAALALPAIAGAEARIGVVDSNRLVLESKAGQLGRAKINALRNRLQQEVEKRRQSLLEAQRSFFDRAPSLSAQKREEEKRLLEEKQIELDRAIQDAQKEVQREGKKIERRLQKTVLDFLGEYGQQHGYTVILDRFQCLFNNPGSDITEEVLAAFNERHPTLP
jgi:outer membrane protein